MKRIALFVTALAIAFGARASFSAVAPSGQTLYFDYVSQNDHTVEVAMHTYYEWNGALVIPDSVENDGVWYTVVGIGAQAFLSLQNHCGPTAITIPNTVRYIGERAFQSVTPLQSVVIGSGVDSIAHNAFGMCYNLEQVTLLNPEPAAFEGGSMNWDFAYTFYSSGVVFNIPCGSLEAYRAAWSQTADFREPVTFELAYGAENQCMGSVQQQVEYTCQSDSAVLLAVPASGYHFVEWTDGVVANPRTVHITCDTAFTARFYTDTLMLTVVPNDVRFGGVSGSGGYLYAEPATVSATAYSGYRFDHWSDGATYNPYTFAVMESMELVAIFVEDGGTNGIEEVVESMIVAYDGGLVVRCLADEPVTVFDAVGRRVAAWRGSNEKPLSLPAGVYVVRVGDTVRKVVAR